MPHRSAHQSSSSKAPVLRLLLLCCTGVALSAAGCAYGVCKTMDFTYGRVKTVCAQRGQEGAKHLMIELVEKARDDGEKLTCFTCHSRLSGAFPRKEGGQEKLGKLLDRYYPKPHK